VANYLLDTTALVDFLNGHPDVVDMVDTLAIPPNRLGVCCVSVAELYAGTNQERRPAADQLIEVMEYHEISRETAKEAGRYRYEFARRGVPLSTADTLIAATAIASGAVLITNNTKDFPMEEIQLMEHP
jgi:predicted nucleic acid-binding protein